MFRSIGDHDPPNRSVTDLYLDWTVKMKDNWRGTGIDDFAAAQWPNSTPQPLPERLWIYQFARSRRARLFLIKILRFVNQKMSISGAFPAVGVGSDIAGTSPAMSRKGKAAYLRKGKAAYLLKRRSTFSSRRETLLS
jgi:hypothetical protein